MVKCSVPSFKHSFCAVFDMESRNIREYSLRTVPKWAMMNVERSRHSIRLGTARSFLSLHRSPCPRNRIIA